MEPLDLGLPISNLDGLRVVLDVAEHAPSKGKGRLLDDSLCSGSSPCDLSPSLRRQTGRPIDRPKPVSNSKTPPTLLAAVLLAVKMFITHRMSPVPGSTCHATKCLSLPRSSSITLVCLFACVSGIILAACVFMFPCTVGCLRDPHHTLWAPNVPSWRSACRLNASVTLSRSFPLLPTATRQQ